MIETNITDEIIAKMALWLWQQIDPSLLNYELKPIETNKEHVITREIS